MTDPCRYKILRKSTGGYVYLFEKTVPLWLKRFPYDKNLGLVCDYKKPKPTPTPTSRQPPSVPPTPTTPQPPTNQNETNTTQPPTIPEWTDLTPIEKPNQDIKTKFMNNLPLIAIGGVALIALIVVVRR